MPQRGERWSPARHGAVTGRETGLAPVLVLVGVLLTGCSAAKGAAEGSPTSAAAQTAVGATASAQGGPSVSSSVVAVAAPAIPVGGQVSLSGWKLTLPVDAAGALAGTAEQLGAASVADPWLVRDADGSLAFWAPVNGAKTADSTHARTELVSTAGFSLGAAVHTLSASLAVRQVPAGTPDICVGQIHGGGQIKSVPFVMLHWRDGNVVVVVKQVLHGSTAQSITLLTGVPLGGRFEYVITDDGNGDLTFTAAYGGQARQATVRTPSAFAGTDERFQAGDYQQAVGGGSANDGGRVTFYAISVS
jgi:hypothetical protein